MAKSPAIAKDPIKAAELAGLFYASHIEPGYVRRARGKGFAYTNDRGRKITARKHLERIKAMHIPPAWSEVWICRDASGHLQATGIDKKGRRQYIYHPLWTRMRAEAKFDRMLPFASKLNTIRKRCEKDLRKHKLPQEKIVALVITLLDSTLIRVGNDEYARKNSSFGLTTFQDDHVTFEKGRATFTFNGKSGKAHTITFEDRRLVKLISDCKDIPGADLFQYYDVDGERHDIKSNHINEYLLETTGMPFTAKDFRTWGGTHRAGGFLAELELAPSEARRKAQITKMVKFVSGFLGNTPTVCRGSYIHPRIIEDFMEGTFHENWARARKKAASAKRKLNREELVVLSYLKL